MAIKKSDNLETLAKGLSLLRLFGAERSQISVQDAADCLGLSRAAARRFVMTLEDLGYLERDGRIFRLTPEVLKLGYTYFSTLDLPTVVKPIFKRLVGKTGEPCGLCVLHRDDIVYIGGMPGTRPYPTTIATGTFFPAYPTAAGRVLLASLPLDQFEDYLRRVKIIRFTPYTVASVEDLRSAVTQARKVGHSIVTNELAYGTIGLGVPIHDGSNVTRASLYVGLQHGTNAKSMREKYLPHVRAAAQEISEILRATRGIPE